MRAPDSWLYFLTALIKGEEAKMVSEAQLEEALEKGDVSEAKGALGGTRLGDFLLATKTDSMRELEAALWAHLSDCIGELLSFSAIPRDLARIIRAYSMKYDLFNLISALRGLLYGAGPPVSFVPLGIMGEMGLLAELTNIGDLKDLCALLSAHGLGIYANVLLKYPECDPEELRKRRGDIEGELWGAYYSELLSLAEGLRDPYFSEAVRASVMISNLKAIFRALSDGRGGPIGGLALEGFLPRDLASSIDSIGLEDLPRFFEGSGYGAMLREALSARSKGGLQAVEETFDKWEEALLRDILSRRLFAPSTIYWYLIERELEVRRVRMAFVRIFDKIYGAS